MHSEEQAEFEALIKDEMPELGAMWFKFYEREPDNYDDAGGFIVRFTLSDQRDLERGHWKSVSDSTPGVPCGEQPCLPEKRADSEAKNHQR